MLTEFGRWIIAMRRYTGVSLIEMAKDFKAPPAVMRKYETGTDDRHYTARQEKLIQAYFHIVCEEKGLPWPEAVTQREKDLKAKERAQREAELEEKLTMGELNKIFKGIFN